MLVCSTIDSIAMYYNVQKIPNISLGHKRNKYRKKLSVDLTYGSPTGCGIEDIGIQWKPGRGPGILLDHGTYTDLHKGSRAVKIKRDAVKIMAQ